MIGLIIYFAIVGGIVIALWKSPPVALAGVLCMFSLEQWGQATHPFFAQHQAFTNFTIGGILLLALATKAFKKEHLFTNYTAIGWLVLGLFGYAFVTANWAPRTDLSLNLWIRHGP